LVGSGNSLRTYTFSDGKLDDVGDLNSNNIATKSKDIKCAGVTRRCTSWLKCIMANPHIQNTMVLMITDGDSFADIADLCKALQSPLESKSKKIYTTVVCVGYGVEHDLGLAEFKKLEQSHTGTVALLDVKSNAENVFSKIKQVLE